MDTIFALASARGKAGVAVIRVSGPQAWNSVRMLAGRVPEARRASVCRLMLEGEALVRPTQRAGGLEGGISTGGPLIVRAAMKPIATTLTPQRTVDLVQGVETPTQYERSDFCPVPRAVPVLEAMIAFVLADSLLEKLGGDSIKEMAPRFYALRKARLSDLPVDGNEHIFWPED